MPKGGDDFFSLSNIEALHPPKTGGSSVFVTLGVGHGHVTLSHKLEMIEANAKKGSRRPPLRDSCLVGTIRNPWDRMTSWFYYGVCPLIEGAPCHWSQGFEEWILAGRPVGGVGNIPQHKYIEHEGECWANILLRQETLQADFDKLCDKIGRKRQRLPVIANTLYPDSKPTWTQEMLDTVEDECRYFGDRYGYVGPGEMQGFLDLLP
jgi:hypothetical protein